MKIKKIHSFFNTSLQILAVILFLGLQSCADSSDVFPAVVLDTTEASVELPNPLSLLVDTTNSQILVANSNVDIFFEQGSLALLSFDASNTSAPQLSAIELIAIPSFSGDMFFDGTSSVYIPFRTESSVNSDRDIFQKFTLSNQDIAFVSEGTVADNPFGITGDATRNIIYTVSNDILEMFDSNLNLLDTVTLTTAESTLSNSDAENVEKIIFDSVNNRLFVSNLDGGIFIVDLGTNELTVVISGPISTRDMIIDNNLLYALDGESRAVWIFDLDQIDSTNSGSPVSVDDSGILIDTISVGNDPNGMALDTTTNRLYVANSFDDTISVIDTLTRKEIARISLDAEDISSSFLRDGDEPRALALGTFNSTTFLFIASYGSNAILVINTSTLNVVEVFPNTIEDSE